MNLIQRFMGRRQFLIAAGAASTCAMTFKNLARFETGVAIAAGNDATVNKKAASSRCPHLLSPLKVRNKVLKNRIFEPRASPHCLHGPENFPADPIRSFYSQLAKNAAIVSIHQRFEDQPPHFCQWEDTLKVHNYFDQLIEDIHCEGSLVGCGEIEGDTIEEVVTNAKTYEDKGYDVVGFERFLDSKEELLPFLERMQAIRSATNLIVVTFVGPYNPEFPWTQLTASGGGMPGGAPPGGSSPMGGGMQGEAPSGDGASPGGDISEGARSGRRTRDVGDAGGKKTSGPELEEVVEMAKMLEGSADIIMMKPAGQKHQNSLTMDKDKPWTLEFAQAIKESGAKIITAPGSGFRDPILNDEWIASGKTDMVAMATPLIADPEYVKKVYEGRADDIVPCVMCHDCHGINKTLGPWFDVCTVNPKFGLSETKIRSIRPPAESKKVAVIGGGPGGMKAAIIASERGHKVTLFEKSDSLGGLLQHTEYTQWKWAYKEFKDYLIRQVNKEGVDVQLKTTATPSMIKAKGFDTVLVATGAEPVTSKIPGAEGKNVYDIVNVYSNKKALGKNVVMIGADVFGTETGICLVKDGYKVTVLTSEKYMIPEKFIGPHNKQNQITIYQNHPDFSYVLETIATRISEGKVFYKDSTGSEKSVHADSVVIYAGLKPRMDEALEFIGSAEQVLLLGDCTGENGTIQKTIRSALFVASQV